MLFPINITHKSKEDLLIDSIKITILVVMSIFLIINFFPFFLGADSLLYGATGVNLAKGIYGIENDLLKESGSLDFVPPQWKLTIHNTAIPKGSVGIFGLSAISYLIGGYYALFYLGPIFTILLLVFSERIATNLFGKLAGLVTLILVATDYMIIADIGRRLLTDNIFAVFFILGCFFLVKFLRQRKSREIFLCSIFFAVSALFRINGVVFFPLEILVLGGFVVFYIIETKRIESINNFLIIKKTFSKIKTRNFFKISILFSLPWLCFFLVFFSYNEYYFGDPLTSYIGAGKPLENQKQNKLHVLFQFDHDRFEWIKYWSVGILQDQVKTTMWDLFPSEIRHFTFKSWVSVFLLLILVSAIMISLFGRIKRTEVIILIIFIAGTLLIHSSSLVTWPIEKGPPLEGNQERHMIFNFVIASMIFGFIIQWLWKINLNKISIKHSKILSKSFKTGFLIIIFLFFLGTFVDSPLTSALMKSDKIYYDPIVKANRYPLDSVLSQDSIVVDSRGRYTIERNAIPFYPYRNYDENVKNSLEPPPQEPTERLKKLIDEGYEVFVFKKKYTVDANYFRYLEAEHGIILKDYSKGICKIEIVNNMNTTNIDESTISDDICYKGWDGKIRPKLNLN